MFPWHIELSCAPGTFEHSHCCSPHEQSSQNCRSACTGVSEAISLIRCPSPPRMSFLLRKLASDHSSPREHTGSFTTDLDVPCWWIKQSPSLHISTWFVLVVHMDRVTALCCLKLGGQMPGKCLTFVCCLSVREDDFHMTLEVGCWEATLCQLMVMLDGRLLTGCPHTSSPTLGTRFVLQALPHPLGEIAHVLGPW